VQTLAEIATYDYTYIYSYCFNLRLAIILQQLMTTHTYLHEAAPTNYDLVHEAYTVQMQITCMRYNSLGPIADISVMRLSAS